MQTSGRVRLIHPSLRANIWQLAGLACATLMVLVLMLAWNVERERQANVWVMHTQATLQALGVYGRGILDVETGQRGYLLTHQEEYLAPYNEALAANPGQLKLLERLITNDDEPKKLRRLSEILKNKTDELALTIRLARAGDMAGALAVVREGRGRRYAVEFHRLAREIADSERALLARREAAVEAENRNILWGMVIGSILAVTLILAGTARTITLTERRAALLMDAMMAVAAGHLDGRLQSDTPGGIGKIAEAFNDMADRLRTAKVGREVAEAELVASARNLATEVVERTAAQGRLFRSVAELKRSNEELDNFAYSASHDLKAPLRGIRNLTEWIAADVKDIAGEDTLANLGLLHNRVERLDMLLDSLLQYSKVGRIGSTPEDVDLARLIADIADYVAPHPGFTVAFRGEVSLVHTNKAPLEQVLFNLVANALKHHDRDTGAVMVSARDLGTLVEFRVADDGPGIPPAFHERVFQMFQTLKSRDEVEGSGMGLAIVKKSVEGHGGTIRIECAPDERGTAFVFTWEKDRHALAA